MNNLNEANQQVKQDLMKELKSDHCIGSPDTGLVLLEYGDYACPASASAQPLVSHLIEAFGDQMTLVYRHFPHNDAGTHAELAAEAAEAAGAQNQFWEMHTLLFKNSPRLGLTELIRYAEELELDVPRFKAEMQDRIYLQRIQEHRRSGALLDLSKTPAFFLNGKIVDVSSSLENLKDAVYSAVNKLES